MKYLLDTHILIWALSDPERLPVAARKVLSEPEEFYFSPVSIWEISIKNSKHPGAMSISSDSAWKLALDSGVQELPISSRHGVAVAELPDIHGDPFDRMLIVQARVDGLTLITHDDTIAKYGDSILKV